MWYVKHHIICDIECVLLKFFLKVTVELLYCIHKKFFFSLFNVITGLMKKKKEKKMSPEFVENRQCCIASNHFLCKKDIHFCFISILLELC